MAQGCGHIHLPPPPQEQQHAGSPLWGRPPRPSWVTPALCGAPGPRCVHFWAAGRQERRAVTSQPAVHACQHSDPSSPNHDSSLANLQGVAMQKDVKIMLWLLCACREEPARPSASAAGKPRDAAGPCRDGRCVGLPPRHADVPGHSPCLHGHQEMLQSRRLDLSAVQACGHVSMQKLCPFGSHSAFPPCESREQGVSGGWGRVACPDDEYALEYAKDSACPQCSGTAPVRPATR